MFILSGGFPLISVSQGMVSVLYPSLSSPGGSSALLPAAVTGDQCPSPAVLAEAGDGVPTRCLVRWLITEHFTFSSFPGITFLQQRGALTTSAPPSCNLLPPSISSLLLPAQAGISRPHPCWAE